MKKVDGIDKRRPKQVFEVLKQYKRPPVKIHVKKVLLIAISILFLYVLSTFYSDLTMIFNNKNVFADGRYLVLFQNNAELRPTGGFIGSFAVVNIKNKRLENYRVQGNVYKADLAYIDSHKIPAPEPFNKIWPNSYMALTSSNWSPDFATAGQEIEHFYQDEYSEQLVGVIALNSTILPELLKLTGPVHLSTLNLDLDSNNVLGKLQQYIEKDYYNKLENQDSNEPKAILGDLAQVLEQKLKHVSKLKLLKLANGLLINHEIQMYLNDPKQEKIVENNKWAVKISQNWQGDYLYINNANLGGGKGSLGVSQSVSYESKKYINGSKEVVLRIKRVNIGRNDYPVAENVNYTRVYVPLGSNINYIFQDGREISSDLKTENDLGKTVFGFWFNTKVGQENEVILSYTVPTLKSQNLVIEHQPGTLADNVSIIKDGKIIWADQLLKQKKIDIL